MDDERILRKVKPTLVIATTVSMKRWVEELAMARETTQAEIVNEALAAMRRGIESSPMNEAVEEREAVAV